MTTHAVWCSVLLAISTLPCGGQPDGGADAPHRTPAEPSHADATNGAMLYLQSWLLLGEDIADIEVAFADDVPEEVRDRAFRLLRSSRRQSAIQALISASRCEAADFTLPVEVDDGGFLITTAGHNIAAVARVLFVDAERLQGEGTPTEAIARYTACARMALHACHPRGADFIAVGTANAATAKLLEYLTTHGVPAKAVEDLLLTLERFETSDPLRVRLHLESVRQDAIHRNRDFEIDAREGLIEHLEQARFADRTARQIGEVIRVWDDSAADPIRELAALEDRLRREEGDAAATWPKVASRLRTASDLVLERLGEVRRAVDSAMALSNAQRKD